MERIRQSIRKIADHIKKFPDSWKYGEKRRETWVENIKISKMQLLAGPGLTSISLKRHHYDHWYTVPISESENSLLSNTVTNLIRYKKEKAVEKAKLKAKKKAEARTQQDVEFLDNLLEVLGSNDA